MDNWRVTYEDVKTGETGFMDDHPEYRSESPVDMDLRTALRVLLAADDGGNGFEANVCPVEIENGRGDHRPVLVRWINLLPGINGREVRGLHVPDQVTRASRLRLFRFLRGGGTP